MNRETIVKECIGCDKVITINDVEVCNAYVYPHTRWRLGNCALASHTVITTSEKDKQRIGQQKSKKKTRKK